MTYANQSTPTWLGRAFAFTAVLCLGLVDSLAGTNSPSRLSLDLNNPHKGFCLWGTSYDSGGANHYGSRMFHVYVPWREVETSDQVFDWDGYEARHLAPILADYPDASFVLRLVVDYPDGPGSGITEFYTGGEPDRDYPKFLEEAPFQVPFINYTSCNGDGPGRTPDWNHLQFSNQIVELIDAYAARFDGDPRITAIQAGVIGLWGEWHQSGCTPDQQPGTLIKQIVRDRYKAKFQQTPVQTRYPRIPDAVGTEFGFYEDYFPSFTAPCLYGFPRCSDHGNWNMSWAMQNETPESADNWKSSPISGESPGGDQKDAWINDTDDVITVLQDYHFSFLGPAGKHEQAGHETVMSRIKRTLGYNLHIDRVVWPDIVDTNVPFEVEVRFANSGSAPAYHEFPVQLSLCDADGTSRWTSDLGIDLRSILPGQTGVFPRSITITDLPVGTYSLRIGVLHPFKGLEPGVLLQSPGRDSNDRYEIGPMRISVLDEDSDGLPDRWERHFFGHTQPMPRENSDADLLFNIDEYILGTNPMLPDQGPWLRWTMQDAQLRLRFPLSPAVGIGYENRTRFYDVQSSRDITRGWENVPGATGINAGQPIDLPGIDLVSGFRLYRLVVRLN